MHKHKLRIFISILVVASALLSFALFSFFNEIFYKNAVTNIPPQKTISLSSTGEISSTPTNTIKTSDNTNKKSTPKTCLVLGYHSINERPILPEYPSLYVYPSEFEKQMKYLKNNNYTPISYEQLEHLDGVEKPVIITFDDGYEDNYTNAYPILKKYDFKATIFIPTSFINTKNYLTFEQIKKMNDLISFQSHTVSHERLTTLSPEKIENELRESQQELSRITGKSVDVLAYPCCDYNDTVAAIAKKYYKYVNTTYTGLYNTGSNPQNITRIFVGRIHKLDIFKERILGHRL